MNSTSLLILIASPIVLATAASATEVSIALRGKAILRAPVITVADVAEVSADDAALKDGIERLELGTPPRVADVGYLWRNQIERQIGLSYPGVLGQIRWQGAKRVEVRVAGKQIDGTRVEQAARTYLEESLGRDYVRVHIELVAAVQPLVVPSGVLAIHARQCGRDLPTRRMCAWVDLSVDDVLFRSIPVWFKVEAYRHVLVSRASIAAGAAFDGDAFAAEVRDVAGVSGKPLDLSAVTPAMQPMRVRRALQPGAVLLSEDIERMPEVARDQEVVVKVKLNGVAIDAPGLALSEGSVGSVVRIQNPSSKEIFRAEVVGAGVVAVNAR